MINEFEHLAPAERELLLKAPALVSILAASGDHEISKEEKAEAIKFAHLKTYTADPLLQPYYKEVELNFEKYFEEAVKKYEPFDEAKREALKHEIGRLNEVIGKLEADYARLLHKSLTGYADHVRKANHVVLEDFIFPLPLPGMNN